MWRDGGEVDTAVHVRDDDDEGPGQHQEGDEHEEGTLHLRVQRRCVYMIGVDAIIEIVA